MAEKRTKFAGTRTTMASERTMLAYFRTGTALILFGLAFLGFQEKSQWFVWTGWTAVGVGVFFLVVALWRTLRHQKEIKRIRRVFPWRN